MSNISCELEKNLTLNGVSDQTIRDELLNISQSYIVQAPAGSGKTELLTQRILALLASVKKPENVLAITFTKKAAAEMRDRVINALTLAQEKRPESPHELKRWELAQKVLKVDKEKQWNLINNPNRLNIYTIDSLSSSLSRSLPLVSQVGTLPKIVEKPQCYYLQAAEDLLSSISQNDQVAENIKTLLIHKDNNLKFITYLIAELLAKRMQWLSRLTAQDHQLTCEQLFDSLNIMIEERLQQAYSLFPKDILFELPELMSQAVNVLRRAGDSRKVNLMQLEQLDAIPKPSGDDIILWKAISEILLKEGNSPISFYKSVNKKNGFPLEKDGVDEQQKTAFKKNKDKLNEILKDLSDNQTLAQLLYDIKMLPDDIENSIENPVLQAVVELLPLAAGHLKLVFQRHNVVDFSEISLSSLNALSADESPTDLALALDYKIDHILVDEFQDTSSSQIVLLELLMASWDSSSDKTLFLVGDPMQSIYRFRDANVSLFMKIAESGLGQLKPLFRQLTINFRSNQKVVDWINETFSSVMPKQNELTLSAVSYASSTAFHLSSNMAFVKSFMTVDEVDHSLQAKEIFKIVKQHLTENKQLKEKQEKKSLAILVKSRAHLSEVVKLLNSASIKYQAVDIEPLFNKMIVKDCLSLAYALTDVYDQLSWASILRSPWFSIKLNDINLIFQQLKISKKSIPEVINEMISETTLSLTFSAESLIRLRRLLPILEMTIQQKGKKPFVKWLYGCYEAVGGLLAVDHYCEFSDLDRALHTLNEFVDGGEIIDRKGISEAFESLYASADPEANNELQIMTIHRSKGLEFDKVILPRLDAAAKGSDSPLLKWTEVIDKKGLPHQLLAVSKKAGQQNDSLYTYINYIEQQKDKYEKQRLLYVAATRAKSELYLFANICRDEKAIEKNGGEEAFYKKPTSSSLLSLLWNEIKDSIKIIQSNNDKEKKAVSESKRIQEFSEKQLSEIKELNNTELQLKSIFPSRKVKQINIEKIVPIIQATTAFSFKLNKTNVLLEDDRGLLDKSGLNDKDDWNDKKKSTDKLMTKEGSIAAIVGTIIHRQLEWLSLQDIEGFCLPNNWNDITLNQLVQAGLNHLTDDLSSYVNVVHRSISNTLNDEFGQFVLSNHQQASSEMILHKKISNDIYVKRVVDRTFVKDGVRWIIDYKSAIPMKDESLSDFIKKEIELHKDKMTEYVELFKQLENKSVIAGLYFTMLPHFEKIYES